MSFTFANSWTFNNHFTCIWMKLTLSAFLLGKMLWSAEKMGRRQKGEGVVEIYHKHQALKAWSRMSHTSSRSSVSLNCTSLSSRNIPRKHCIQIFFPVPHWEKQNMKAKLRLLLKTIVRNTADSMGNIATNKTIHSAQMHFSSATMLSSQLRKWCH